MDSIYWFRFENMLNIHDWNGSFYVKVLTWVIVCFLLCCRRLWRSRTAAMKSRKSSSRRERDLSSEPSPLSKTVWYQSYKIQDLFTTCRLTPVHQQFLLNDLFLFSSRSRRGRGASTRRKRKWRRRDWRGRKRRWMRCRSSTWGWSRSSSDGTKSVWSERSSRWASLVPRQLHPSVTSAGFWFRHIWIYPPENRPRNTRADPQKL